LTMITDSFKLKSGGVRSGREMGGG